MKIHKIQGDISSDVANSFKDSVAIDTEATGLLIPERDKLSLVQICNEGGDVYVIQPDRTNYKMPNLVSVLENEKIQKIGHFLRFDKSALEYFLKCKMKNIFCTKIASKICRTYTDQHGLKNLVQEFCNKKLDKNKFDENPICVLVGPEGDFSEEEREKILKYKSVCSIKINDNILRSETAVISSLSIVNYAIS